MADDVRPSARMAEIGRTGRLDGFLALDALFSPALPNDPAFAGAVRTAYERLQSGQLPA